MFNKYRDYYKALLQLSYPIILGQIGIVILGFADTLMIGQHSSTELAAASFINSIMNLFIITATGYSYGFTPIVGALYSIGEYRIIGSKLKSNIICNFILSLFFTLCLSLIYIFLNKFGQPNELIQYMRPYLLTQLISMVAICVFNSFKQFADGISYTKLSMWIILMANALNILGNYILIYGKFGAPELGLLGAGISTLISRFLMLVIIVAIFIYSKRFKEYRCGFIHSYNTFTNMIAINKLSIPISAQLGMETALFSIATIMVGWLGSAELAAHQIVCTVSTLGFMIYYGMGAAISIKISNNYGIGDFIKLKQTASAGLHLIFLLATVACLLFYLIRNVLGSWFTNDAEVISLAISLVPILILYQYGDALQITYANVLRGIAYVKPLMIASFIAYFVISLPASYILGFTFNLGLVGLWLGYPIGLFSSGILFYACYKYRLRSLFARSIDSQQNKQ